MWEAAHGCQCCIISDTKESKIFTVQATTSKSLHLFLDAALYLHFTVLYVNCMCVFRHYVGNLCTYCNILYNNREDPLNVSLLLNLTFIQ